MAYKVVYKKSVNRDLKQLPKEEARHILDRIEDELTKNPESNPLLKGRFSSLRSLRIGDYRVIYAVMDAGVLVLRIGHRRDVYKGG